jgi:hypothetical protein
MYAAVQLIMTVHTAPSSCMGLYKALGDHSRAAITHVWQPTDRDSTKHHCNGSHRPETGPSKPSVYPRWLKVRMAKSAHPPAKGETAFRASAYENILVILQNSSREVLLTPKLHRHRCKPQYNFAAAMAPLQTVPAP